MTKTRIKPKWLRLTEEINALDYLEQAYYFIQQTEKNDIAWKWVVITLHGALYGFAVCACKGTSSNNVIERGNHFYQRPVSKKSSKISLYFKS